MNTENELVEPTAVEAAVLHLMLAQLDIYRVMVLADVTGSDAVIKEGADRYWRAFTRGWGRDRHARVFLLQCIDEAKAGKVMARAFAALGREKLAGSSRPTPFDNVFEVFSAPPFKQSFESAVQQEEFSEAESIRAMYSAAYPFEARRLTDEQLERALVEWPRTGGHRKRDRDPHKWELFANLVNAIGLGPIKPGTLSRDWWDWLEKLRSGADADPMSADPST